MLTVAVTGHIGAGKSTVLRIFQEKNYPVCQADDMARSLLTSKGPCKTALKALFGPKFLLKTGKWNHKALAREIFQNPEKRQQMETLIHPLVQKKFEEQIHQWKAQGASLVFYEIPLITSAITHSRFNLILFVEANKRLTIQRLLKKGLDNEDIKLRMRVQQSYSHLKKTADFIIHNEGSLKDLKKKTEKVLNHILSPHSSEKTIQKVF